MNYRHDFDQGAAESSADVLATERAWELLDVIPHIVWVAGADGAIEYLNRRGRDFIGLAPGLARSGNWLDLLHPNDRGAVFNRWQSAIGLMLPWEERLRLRGKDGAYQWFSLNAAPMPGAVDTRLRWMITCTETTGPERTEAQPCCGPRQLEELCASLDVLLEHAPVGFAYLDREFRFVRVSHSLSWIGEVCTPNWKGCTVEEVAPGFWARLGPSLVQAAHSGIPVIDREWSGELAGDPGHVHHWLIHAYPIWLGGAVVGVGMIAIDVTDQRDARERERASEAHFRAVCEASPLGICVIQPDGRVTYSNPAKLRILGMSWEEAQKLTWYQKWNDTLHPDDRERVLAEQQKAKQHGTVFRSVARYILKDGVVAWRSISTARVIDGDRFLGYVGIVEDVTESKKAEAELRRSEKRYRSLVEAMAQTVWTANADGELIGLLGGETFLPPSQGRQSVAGWLSHAHPDDQAVLVEGWKDAMAHRCPTVSAYRALRADGKWRHVIGRAVPVLSAKGDVEEWVGVVIDVTEQHRAEEQLRQTMAQLAEANRLAERNYALLDTLIRCSPIGIVLIDTSFRTLHINPELAALDGRPVSQQIGRTVAENVPELWPRLEPIYHQVLATGEPIVNLENSAVVACPSGQLRHRLSSFFPVRLGGEIIGIGIMVVDITERKEAEAELRRSEKRYRSLVNALAHIVWTTDPQGNLRSMIGGEAFLETHEERMSVEAWDRITHPDDRAIIEAAKIATETQGKPFEARYRMRRRAGEWRHMFIRAVPVVDEDGQVEEFVGVTMDLTEQKQLEEQFRQSQKMEAVGQLAGGVAHDFNNILTVINGYSDLILGQLRAEDRLRSAVSQIVKAGQRARELTGQLLAFSRQQMLGPPSVLNLNVVVEDAENMLRRVIGEHVILRSSLAPNLRSIKADAGEMHQVIMNLTVNARDAMPNGGHLSIDTANVVLDENYAQSHLRVEPGEYVMLAVTDSGTGMDDATRARVFEPFFTTKGPGKGTGLGLATVYGIVRQAGGHITVHTEVGKGTSFKVYLPITQEAAAPAPEAVGLPTMEAGTETVLLVEDEDAVREMTAEILMTCGYTVLQAANGQEAMALLPQEKERIRLLISDVVMPHMGGRELAKRATEMVPGLGVLFLSGYTADAVVRHGVSKAEYAFLQKPFTPTDLAHKVREVLDRR